MPFASGLRESLQVRGTQVPAEFIRGDTLEHVLDRHLLAVERHFDGELITSILLLSPDGKRLSHGSAPNLPRSYCEAIDGVEIGPCVGSCGTAAYLGRPVYVSDIATDPLWADYRHLALPLGFRSCWSTPIRAKTGAVIGTFATYHRTAGGPTREEIEAIGMITEHVAHAIMWARAVQDLEPPGSGQARAAPRLKLVSGDFPVPDAVRLWPGPLVKCVDRLESLAAELERHANNADSEELKALLKSASANSRRLVTAIRRDIEHGGGPRQ